MGEKDTITNVEKYSPGKTPPYFWHKVDYKGYTNDRTRGSDDSPSETDDSVRFLDKENENEED